MRKRHGVVMSRFACSLRHTFITSLHIQHWPTLQNVESQTSAYSERWGADFITSAMFDMSCSESYLIFV